MSLCPIQDCGAPAGTACTYASCPGRTYKHCSARTSPAQRSKEAGVSPRARLHTSPERSHAARITGQFA